MSVDISDEPNVDEIAEVIAHLAFRSAHLRGVIRDAASAMGEAALDLVKGEFESESMPRLPMHEVPTVIEEAMRKALDGSDYAKSTNLSKKAIIDLVYLLIREKFELLKSEATAHLGPIIEKFLGNTIELGRSAHTSVLQDAMAPQKQIERLQALKWKIEEFPGGNAILPDCTSIAFDGENWQPLIFVSTEKLQAVILPLSPNRFAVGRASESTVVSLADFNQNASHACYNFFLSSGAFSELDDLHPELGGRLHSEISTMTRRAMSEAVGNFVQTDGALHDISDLERAGSQGWAEAASNHEEPWSYEISLFGFGDEGLAQRLADTVGTIVRSVAQFYPVEGIDGFTFAADYQDAVTSLDRGYVPATEIKFIEDGEKIGVGMPITIIRGEEYKTRIVMRAFLALDLLSENEAERDAAIRIVISFTASAALSKLMQRKFPSQVMQPISDSFEAWLYSNSSNIYDTFFCTRLSANPEKDIGQFEEWAVSSFRQSAAQIFEARIQYYQDFDHEELFAVATDALAKMMKMIAMFLAARAEPDFPKTELSESDLAKLLSRNALGDWLKLFADDLERFHARIENWSDFNEIFFLNRHLSRLLFHFGIQPDKLDSGQLYIHVSADCVAGTSLR